MKRIVVFCGSSEGSDSRFREEALLLGKTLAARNAALVYGGAQVGLMGAVAEGVLKNGGEVIGVIPRFLCTKEVAHEGLTDLIVVESMHERKMKMHELSDGIITLPGGFGTFEELFEMLTWAQLGLHAKPIGLLNTNGFYNDLIAMIRNMVEKGFLRQINEDMLLVADDIDTLLQLMDNYVAPEVPKWIRREEQV